MSPISPTVQVNIGVFVYEATAPGPIENDERIVNNDNLT